MKKNYAPKSIRSLIDTNKEDDMFFLDMVRKDNRFDRKMNAVS